MDWKVILSDLRGRVPPGGGGVVPGSLRWLEARMRERGANPSSVRNIVYRDVGTARDKAQLREVLAELARDLGVALPEAAAAVTPASDELELLGRSKKRAFRQFTAGVRSGRAPRLIVSGPPGAGKTVLLARVARALEAQGVAVRSLRLSGDDALPAPEGRVGSSFAAQAQAQLDAARRVLPTGGALLLRVSADLRPLGFAPRLPGGEGTDAATWATETLLRRAPAGVAVLLAVEGDAPDGSGVEVIELRPPTPTEARAYLMDRLGVTRAEADRLVRETGRHLDRLTLLANVAGEGGAAPAELLADPESRRLVTLTAALQAAHPTGRDRPERDWPEALLAALLGGSPLGVPPHARALLLGGVGGWRATPALERAWPVAPPGEVRAALRAVAGLDAGQGFGPYRLGALAALGDWAALAAQVAQRPDDARHLPALWPRVRSATGAARESLARAVVMHHAGRGEYNDPRARDALFTLLESGNDAVRGWARVKLAESSLEAGRMDAALAQLQHPDVTGMDSQDVGARDPWAAAAEVDALLVRAALARWQGDLGGATRAAQDPRLSRGGPRALLWRGLIAKDAGRWPEALEALRAVPAASPLLSARARYQEGDLLLRLGQPQEALGALLDAGARLSEAGGSPEERARVLARAGTALRRLGRPAEGLERLGEALALVPPDERRHVDGVPRARLLSEGVPLLLALGRVEDAQRQAALALSLLSRSEARPAEAGYRERRTRYRAALTYLTRGLGVPYLPPLGGAQVDSADLRQARRMLEALLEAPAARVDREVTLRFDMLLSLALATPDAALATALVQEALTLASHPYEEAQARAMLGDALLRAGQPEAALGSVNRAHALLRRPAPGGPPRDPGIDAQLLALETRAELLGGAASPTTRNTLGTPDILGTPGILVTLDALRSALESPDLRPFRAGVWREAGRALEQAGAEVGAILAAWGVPAALVDWGAPDALAAWAQVRDEAARGGYAVARE
ncbi:tetratricopeptide repeat protein [Deinococcus sp. JMULE3]|uniref:tetratricopeptide repeat protein n=1 Tax=Deinococcus sp. JMULE3 TaxID=2518341 RepID=UPI00157577C3